MIMIWTLRKALLKFFSSYQNEEPKLDDLSSSAQSTSQQLRCKKKEGTGQKSSKMLLVQSSSLSPLPVISLSKLIGMLKASVDARLNALRSVVNVPNDETRPVRLFHSSFRDFLVEPDTRGKTPILGR